MKRACGTAPPTGPATQSSPAPQLAAAAVASTRTTTGAHEAQGTPYFVRRPCLPIGKGQALLLASQYILATAPLASLSRPPSISPTIVTGFVQASPFISDAPCSARSIPSHRQTLLFFCPSIAYSYSVIRHTVAGLRITITKPEQTADLIPSHRVSNDLRLVASSGSSAPRFQLFALRFPTDTPVLAEPATPDRTRRATPTPICPPWSRTTSSHRSRRSSSSSLLLSRAAACMALLVAGFISPIAAARRSLPL